MTAFSSVVSKILFSSHFSRFPTAEHVTKLFSLLLFMTSQRKLYLVETCPNLMTLSQFSLFVLVKQLKKIQNKNWFIHSNLSEG